MKEANVDLISNNQSQGVVANALQKGGSLNINKKRPYLDDEGNVCVTVFTGGDPTDLDNYEARFASDFGLQVNTDTTLTKEEWLDLDNAVIEVGREELTVYDYFVGKGLTKPLKNAFGTTVLQWQTISDSQSAIMSMDAVARGQGDRVQYADKFLPVPILHADYEINARFLAVSRKDGNGVDVEEAANAARRIMEKKEDLLIGSGTYTFGGGTMYTLLNFPDRNLVTITDWNASATTGAMIVADVRELKRANKDALHGGNGVLIIPSDYEDKLGEDYSVSGGSLMTIRERIMKLGGITDILVSERLADNNILFVELNKRTIEIVTGMSLTNIYWETEGGMVGKYKLMEITVPRLKSDYNGKCGIAHGAISHA
jgi:uncharacterized linocin/CFP29 family protein